MRTSGYYFNANNRINVKTALLIELPAFHYLEDTANASGQSKVEDSPSQFTPAAV